MQQPEAAVNNITTTAAASTATTNTLVDNKQRNSIHHQHQSYNSHSPSRQMFTSSSCISLYETIDEVETPQLPPPISSSSSSTTTSTTSIIIGGRSCRTPDEKSKSSKSSLPPPLPPSNPTTTLSNNKHFQQYRAVGSHNNTNSSARQAWKFSSMHHSDTVDSDWKRNRRSSAIIFGSDIHDLINDSGGGGVGSYDDSDEGELNSIMNSNIHFNTLLSSTTATITTSNGHLQHHQTTNSYPHQPAASNDGQYIGSNQHQNSIHSNHRSFLNHHPFYQHHLMNRSSDDLLLMANRNHQHHYFARHHPQSGDSVLSYNNQQSESSSTRLFGRPNNTNNNNNGRIYENLNDKNNQNHPHHSHHKRGDSRKLTKDSGYESASTLVSLTQLNSLNANATTVEQSIISTHQQQSSSPKPPNHPFTTSHLSPFTSTDSLSSSTMALIDAVSSIMISPKQIAITNTTSSNLIHSRSDSIDSANSLDHHSHQQNHFQNQQSQSPLPIIKLAKW